MAIDSETLGELLNLPEEDRAELAHRLLISLAPADIEIEHQAAWAAEIERRLSAYDRGESSACDWRPAIERIRKSFQRRTA